MSVETPPYLTPAQYFEIQRTLIARSEYIDGQIYEIAGSSRRHAEIGGRLLSLLIGQMAAGTGEVFGPNMLVETKSGGPFLYPDVSVTFGEGEDEDMVLRDPAVVIEVLSAGGTPYDKRRKFTMYRKLASLREYVLVWQTQPRIEVHRREPSGTWILLEFAGADAICRLESVGCELALADVYRQRGRIA